MTISVMNEQEKPEIQEQGKSDIDMRIQKAKAELSLKRIDDICDTKGPNSDYSLIEYGWGVPRGPLFFLYIYYLIKLALLYSIKGFTLMTHSQKKQRQRQIEDLDEESSPTETVKSEGK
jgi:hypothetical protein